MHVEETSDRLKVTSANYWRSMGKALGAIIAVWRAPGRTKLARKRYMKRERQKSRQIRVRYLGSHARFWPEDESDGIE